VSERYYSGCPRGTILGVLEVLFLVSERCYTLGVRKGVTLLVSERERMWHSSGLKRKRNVAQFWLKRKEGMWHSSGLKGRNVAQFWA